VIKEFREFIARGNVIDLAVAVVIGAAFGRIITSLVDGVIMPPIGLLLGGVDFSSLFQRGAGVAGRGEGTGHSRRGLWCLPQRDRQLPHRRVRGVPPREAGEPHEGAGGGAEHQDMPVLLVCLRAD
jgi:hypothetical protein